MKRIIKVCVFCVAVLCCSLLGMVSIVNTKTNTNDPTTYTSNLSEFLQFEQAIIDINNETTPSTTPQRLNSLSQIVSPGTTIETANKFELKRLIVHGKLKETYGATDVISYGNLHILCYDSAQTTSEAFDLLSQDHALNIIPDKIQSIAEYAEQDYSYTSYKNWGAESIDIGGYREFLVDNSVTKEVVVVVLDTGINTSHPMFRSRLLKDATGKIKGFSYHNSTYTYSAGQLSFDVDDPSTPNYNEADTNKYSFEDDNGHGSHVAGIICNLTPNNVKILPIKIGNTDGYSTTSVMLNAFLRVVNVYAKQYNIVSTNLSYSGGGKSDNNERDTFNTQCYQPLHELNILPITAAGNEYEEINIEGLQSVVVSALKQQDNSYEFDRSYSNYGKIIDICAPGTSVISAGIASSNGACAEYVPNSGTSMASPQVAGIAALLYLNPNLPQNFTATDIEETLYSLSLDLGLPGKDIYYGHGMLNLKYFESVRSDETITFYINDSEITEYREVEFFQDSIDITIQCSDPQYTIIYYVNEIPTLQKSHTYTSSININSTSTIYVMGVKIENNEITERTALYSILLFNENTPLEDCFSIDYSGCLTKYTGYFEHIVVPSTIKGIAVTSTSPSLFKGTNLVSITLPEAITSISGYVFQYCHNLKYVYAPNVTKTYIAAFSDCLSITRVLDEHPSQDDTTGVFLPNLTEVTSFTFNHCTNLESVSLTKLETLNGGYDFQSCSNLKSVYLPNITSIPKGLFSLCTSLSGSFEINKNITEIGTRAFYGCQFTSFSVENGNQHLFTDGKGIYSKNSIVAFAAGNKNSDYTILNKVSINGYTHTISQIGQLSITSAEFNSLTIPSSITQINEWALSDTIINKLYFNSPSCSSNGYFHDGGTFNPFENITTIEIGANVSRVPTYLFRGVNCKHIIINSYSTQFDKSCFLKELNNDTLDSLTFNFNNNITTTYLDTRFQNSKMLTYGVNYIYSKTELPIESVSNYYIRQLIYSKHNGQYYVYSKTPFDFTITSSSNQYGTISPSGQTTIQSGESITYTFGAHDNCYLKSIIIDNVPLSQDELNLAMNNGYTFSNVKANHSIKAVFAPNTYSITASAHPNGSITPNGVSIFNHGDSITYTITPDTGYIIKFVEVDGKYIGKINQYTFTNITTNHTIRAEFEKQIIYVTITHSDGGRVTPNGFITYYYGDSLNATINPENGFIVANILVNNNPYPVTDNLSIPKLTKDTNIHIDFVRTHTITTHSDHGTITPSFQAIDGTDIKIDFTPDEGYSVKNIFVNDKIVDTHNQHFYIIENVDQAYNIVIEYEAATYSIVVTTKGNGSYTSDNNLDSVIHGSTVKFDISPEEGWNIKSILINNENVQALKGILSIENIKTNLEISILFEPIPIPWWERIDTTTLILIIAAISVCIISTSVIINIIKKRQEKNAMLALKEKTQFYQELPYLSTKNNHNNTHSNYYRRVDDKDHKK